MQNTDKLHIQHLVEICVQKGVQQVVLSPGSRCAPLVIAFNRHSSIKCFSIVDERSAAFFALGLAQQTLLPTALVCTSGSAVLNYAPAVAEAYYQKLPLILLTADRPNEWIDQGENQSIQQFEVFKNYIKKSVQLPVNVLTKEDMWYCDRLISEAINSAVYPDFGPVHINIPLREPLYQTVEVTQAIEPKIVHLAYSHKTISEELLANLAKEWSNFSTKLIVVGQQENSADIDATLAILAQRKDTVVLCESISNVAVENAFYCIDPLVEVIEAKALAHFVPDLIVTFGKGVVSKKLKFWLRKKSIKAHWHISKSNEHWDNFQALSKVIPADAVTLLEVFGKQNDLENEYAVHWKTLNTKIAAFTATYLANSPFSDFKVFEKLVPTFPADANIHFGNSTPVRYANLIKQNHHKINANRGVSGIDGQVSTALGASVANGILTICITGDLALMYDSNALWNNYLHPNFKIILINNQGGNIFRIIPGPNQLDELETYFETKNTYQAEHLARLHQLAYFKIDEHTHFEQTMQAFYAENNNAAIVEICTNGKQSAAVLSTYFQTLRQW